MNVLILAKDSGVGGIASCTATLAKGLIDLKKANVVIGIPKGSGVDFQLKEYNVQIIEFERTSLFQIMKNYRKVAVLAKQYKVDIIHAQNRIPALYASVYCFFHRKVRYIWVNHLVPIPCDWKHRIMTKYGYCAVTDCVDGREMLVEKLKIPKNKVKIIHLGVDIRRFKRTTDSDQRHLKENLGIRADEKIILLYGNLSEHKGHMFLLESISGIGCRNYKLIFPGENKCYKEQIIATAQKYGIEDKLIFPGFISGIDFLSIADLMVLPSIHESFGIATIEAFSMGVPVIRTKAGGYEDMKDMCFGVNYGDVETFAHLLKSFFENDPIFESMAKKALLEIKRFSLETMTNQYYSLYESAIQSR